MPAPKLRAELARGFDPDESGLRYVVSRKCHQIPLDDPLFVGLRDDYPTFDTWFARCRETQRDCWIVEVNGELAGLVIRKGEAHSEAQTQHPGPRILKICTLKMKPAYFGEKFGEQLLKKIFWFAHREAYDLIYVTVFPKHDFLIGLLKTFGFEATQKRDRGELVMERPIRITTPTPPLERQEILSFDLRAYPHFYDGPAVRKYVVPIRSEFHVVLFPEIADPPELPLFPEDGCRVMSPSAPERTPGNTIRKVYICRSPTRTMEAADVVLFYLSKCDHLRRSQSVTTIGTVVRTECVTSADDLLDRVGRRSVFPRASLEHMRPTAFSPVLVIDFLLNGHLDPPVGLSSLLKVRAFLGTPTLSIKRVSDEAYTRLKSETRIALE
jgi:hypothetical protein